VSEGWHGVRFAKPLARTREYVDIVNLALSRERVRYAGNTYTLPLPDGPGKALHLMLQPVREHIPIYLAAIGPEEPRALRRDRRRLAAGLLRPRTRRRTAGAHRSRSSEGRT